jgi:putative hydrolases of HD superfamily
VKKKLTKKSKELALVNFFAEAGLLKRVKRSGWWVAGIKDPESVAEHSFRTAIMGFCLAEREGVDPLKVMTMALFNDIHESRINDLHKMGHYYIDFKNAEKKVFHDQVADLPSKLKAQLSAFRREYDAQETAESILARDVDILECLIQAKEYYQDGHERAKYFLTRAPEYLKSTTAKKLWKVITRWDSDEWWRSVVKFER